MLNRIVAGWNSLCAAVSGIDANLQKLSTLTENAAAGRQKRGAWDLRMGHLELMTMYLERLDLMTALSHPRFNSPLRLERFGHKTFSQHDEDGIIAEIFRRIGATSRVFVEIAAGDGLENCTALLLLQGWSGLWVECDAENLRSIRDARRHELASGQLKLSSDFVTPETVNDVIEGSGIASEIDLVVIDIDGNDYHLLEALTVRPRVICAEYCGTHPPPMRWIMPRVDQHRPWVGQPTGASLQSLEELLTPRGYSLVGSSIVGANCFFVRGDLAEGKFEAPFTAYNHYNSPRFWYPSRATLSTVWNGPADGKPPPL